MDLECSSRMEGASQAPQSERRRYSLALPSEYALLWLVKCASSSASLILTPYIGTDIVPLYPNLRRIGMHDIADRVTWVHASMYMLYVSP